MELWDLFDKKRLSVHRVHMRGEPITQDLYHIVVAIWTVNSKRQLLVTLRDSSKEVYPNTWENTGGSALSGESSLQAAVRELHEETGIITLPDKLTLIDSFRGESAFHDTYVLHRDIPIAQLQLQPGETVAAQWVSMEQLDQMVSDGTLAKPIGQRYLMLRERLRTYLDRLSQEQKAL